MPGRGTGQAWGHGCSPEPARVDVVGWEAVLDHGAGGQLHGAARLARSCARPAVCAGVARSPRCTVSALLSWARGSRGPLSPAGLASKLGLAVSAGCPAAVLGSSFSARAAVGGDGSAWRGRAGRAPVW